MNSFELFSGQETEPYKTEVLMSLSRVQEYCEAEAKKGRSAAMIWNVADSNQKLVVCYRTVEKLIHSEVGR